jgi:hypothetical protein
LFSYEIQNELIESFSELQIAQYIPIWNVLSDLFFFKSSKIHKTDQIINHDNDNNVLEKNNKMVINSSIVPLLNALTISMQRNPYPIVIPVTNLKKIFDKVTN